MFFSEIEEVMPKFVIADYYCQCSPIKWYNFVILSKELFLKKEFYSITVSIWFMQHEKSKVVLMAIKM